MLFDDTFKTIETTSEGQFRDRGSKFFGFAFPVKSEVEIKEIINRIKKEHSQGNHHCYAFRLTPDPSVYRASDDREPSGSAGKPILGAIQSLQLTNTLVIVVRYFGGSLLGVPGLIAAYRAAAQDALQNANIITLTVNEGIEIIFPYESINDVHSLLKSEPTQIISQSYENPCVITIEIRKSRSQQFIEKLKHHPTLAMYATWKIIN
jgi:uncharacterized YigZ family protein